MLGNWSFGDFFKKEICMWSWELLTQVYGLDKDRLYVTYFGGSSSLSLDPDNECKDIWINIVGVDSSHVIPGSMKDNFWEMGETGPCGPCSEIHYDRIGNRNAAHLVNMEDPNVLEIWNLVFIQFNREKDLSLKPLPKKNVDTGMGFERLVSVIQNKTSNYDTDIFRPLFAAIQNLTNCRPYTGKVGSDDVDGIDMAYRVVADHARTLTIALSDGGRPENVGRGYVLRRILRRAVRYSNEKLNAKPGMFASLVPTVIEILGDFFPELNNDPQSVMDIINEEEAQFLKTLSRGRRLLERTVGKLNDDKVLPGNVAWRLYDTYGFPVDLTQLMVEEKGLTIDMAEYEECKAKAQAMSYSKTTSQQSPIELNVHAIAELKDKMNILLTNDKPKYNYTCSDETSEATYSFATCTATVLALRKDDQFVDSVESGFECGVILDQTNFYAEAGGQIFDTGFITLESIAVDDEEMEFEVKDVKCQGGYIVHLGQLASGTLKVKDKVKLQIDEQRRKLVMNNHTCTHILNFALRKVLESEPDQRGSLVAPDRLRFDFTHKGPLKVDHVKEIEKICQTVIASNSKVYSNEVQLGVAKVIEGLRAVFDETYPDLVRVVSIGVSTNELLADPKGQAGHLNSVELCGGTHLLRSGHIGDFVISSEEGISKGVRRMIALTGPEASKSMKKAKILSQQIDLIKSKMKPGLTIEENKKLVKEIVEMIEEVSQSSISHWRREELRDCLNNFKKKLDNIDRVSKAAKAGEAVDAAKQIAEESADKPFIVRSLNAGTNAKTLDAALKQVRLICPSTPVMFFSHDDKKVLCLSWVPAGQPEAKELKANEWIQQITSVIGGKGGGKAESAQASGTNINSIDEAISVASKFAQIKLS